MAWPSLPMVCLPSCLACPGHSAIIIVGVPTGQVYSWGTGPLGLGSPTYMVDTPRLIRALAHAKAAQVVCDPSHSLVLTEDNVLYSFGHFLVHPLSVLTN
jgi:alpha-tubulin suppressor-like RCC1 family protein